MNIRDQRRIGSKPTQPAETDPDTERVRAALKNPYAAARTHPVKTDPKEQR